jgi:hypothetical protein
MRSYPSILDPEFDRAITLRDAYRVMERVVAAHVGRGPVGTVDLLSYLGLRPDGTSGDPAAVGDFLDATEEVLGPPPGPGVEPRAP